MVDYTALANVATDLLTENGQTLTFTRKTETAFNPVGGTVTETSSTYTAKGAGFGYRKSEIDGEVVQISDVRLIIEDSTTAPIIKDTVIYNGSSYRVMNVEEVSPGGIVVIYKLQVRL